MANQILGARDTGTGHHLAPPIRTGRGLPGIQRIEIVVHGQGGPKPARPPERCHECVTGIAGPSRTEPPSPTNPPRWLDTTHELLDDRGSVEGGVSVAGEIGASVPLPPRHEHLGPAFTDAELNLPRPLQGGPVDWPDRGPAPRAESVRAFRPGQADLNGRLGAVGSDDRGRTAVVALTRDGTSQPPYASARHRS